MSIWKVKVFDRGQRLNLFVLNVRDVTLISAALKVKIVIWEISTNLWLIWFTFTSSANHNSQLHFHHWYSILQMKNWIGLSNNRLCFIKWLSEVCDPCIGKISVVRRFVFEASQGTLFFSMRSLLAEEWLPLCRTELPRPWTLLFIEIQNLIFGRKIKEVWMRQILSAWKLERVDCITKYSKESTNLTMSNF